MPIPNIDPIVNIPMITPFDEQDRVDHDAVGRNVERWLTTKAECFLVGSQSGEEWFLSENEKLEICQTARDALGGQRCLLGGIDCPSVTETLNKAEAFAKAGAEMVRIRLPRYESTLLDYFKQVVPRSPVPVLLMHQSNPEKFGAAGNPAASPEIIGEVCSMDNVFGYTTDHDVRFEWRVRQRVPSNKRFWICNGSMMLHGTSIGCNGTTTAFSNIWPSALHRLLSLGMEGKYTEAQALQEHIRRIDEIMLPFQAAGVKAAMNLMGYDGTHPRRPTNSFPSKLLPALESAIETAREEYPKI